MISNEEILRALSLASGAVIITGLDGVIQYASPGMFDLTGYMPEELTGTHTRIFNSGSNAPAMYDELWENALATQTWEGLLRNKHKDGSTYLERMRVFPLTDANGKLTHFVATKEKAEHPSSEIEFTVPEHENDETVLDTVVNLASEFQSSLQMVLGFAQIVHDDLEETLTGAQKEYFDIVIRTVQRLLRTLDETVLLARLESDVVVFKPERINIAEELRQLVSKMYPLHDSSDVRFIKVIEDNGAEVTIDRESFGTIMSHLLINAMKFTKEGSVTVGLQTQNNQAVIWVIDTGVGISEQFKPKLFESFKQEELGFHKDFEGAGLGLAITRTLVDKLGGSLTFESYKGSGSTFIVSFPITGWEDRIGRHRERMENR